jgi:hypothetical protein
MYMNQETNNLTFLRCSYNQFKGFFAYVHELNNILLLFYYIQFYRNDFA